MDTKKPWQSKTIILNTVLALAAMFYPPVATYISTHPEVVAGVFAVLNIILRFVSKDKIGLES